MAEDLSFGIRITAQRDGTFRAEVLGASSDLQKVGAAASGVGRQAQAAGKDTEEFTRRVRGLNDQSQNLSRTFGQLRNAIVALGLARVAQEVVAAELAFNRINQTLKFATGSAEAANREWAFLRATAQRLGLDLQVVSLEYAKLAAAAKAGGIELDQVRQLFIGVSQAATVMGLSSQDAGLVFLALQQIVSKGKVSMEEMRQQLGERLPGAMAILAEAMGVSTRELEKLIEKGIDARTFVERFGPAMQRAFGKEAAEAAKTLNAELQRFRTNLFETRVAAAEGFSGPLTEAFREINKSLTDPAFRESMRDFGRYIGDTLKWVVENRQAVGDFFRNMPLPGLGSGSLVRPPPGTPPGTRPGLIFRTPESYDAEIAETEATIADLRRRYAHIPNLAPGLPKEESRLAGLRADRATAVDRLYARTIGMSGEGSADISAIVGLPFSSAPRPPGPVAAGRSETADKYLKDLEFEASLIGKSNLERKIAESLKRSEAGATGALHDRVVALVTAIEGENEAQKVRAELIARFTAELEDEGKEQEEADRRTRERAQSLRESTAARQEELALLRTRLGLSGADERTQRIEVEFLEAKQRLLREQKTLSEDAIEQIRRETTERVDLQMAIEQQERAAENYRQVWRNALEDVQRFLTDRLYNALRGNLSTWEDWGEAVLDIVARLAANLAAQRIILPFVDAGFSALGLPGGSSSGSSGSGMPGIGDIFSGGKGLFEIGSSLFASGPAMASEAAISSIFLTTAEMPATLLAGTSAATAGAAGAAGGLASIGGMLAAAAPYAAVAAVALPFIMSMFEGKPSVGPSLITNFALAGSDWGAAANPSQRVAGRFWQGYGATDNLGDNNAPSVAMARTLVDTLDRFFTDFGLAINADIPGLADQWNFQLTNYLEPKEGSGATRGVSAYVAGELVAQGVDLATATVATVKAIVQKGIALGAIDITDPIRLALERSQATTVEQLFADVAAPGNLMQSFRDTVTAAGPNGQAILQIRGLTDALTTNLRTVEDWGLGAEGATAALDAFKAQLTPIVHSLDTAQLDAVFTAVGRGSAELLSLFGSIGADMKAAAEAQLRASTYAPTTAQLMLDATAQLMQASTGLLEYQQSLLTGPLSALAPGAQFQEVERRFRSLLPEVNQVGPDTPISVSAIGGERAAQIQAMAPEFLQAALGFYGSTSSAGYAAAWRLVQSALAAAGAGLHAALPGISLQADPATGIVPLDTLLGLQYGRADNLGLNVPRGSAGDLYRALNGRLPGFARGGSIDIPAGADNVVPLFRAHAGETVSIGRSDTMAELVTELRALRLVNAEQAERLAAIEAELVELRGQQAAEHRESRGDARKLETTVRHGGARAGERG